MVFREPRANSDVTIKTDFDFNQWQNEVLELLPFSINNNGTTISFDADPGVLQTVFHLDKSVSSGRIGKLTYHLEPGNELYVISMENKFKGRLKNVGTALLARLLAEHPEIDRISAQLAEDNWEAYSQARSQNVAHHEAVEQTPFVKMLRKLGFTGRPECLEPASEEFSLALSMDR